MELASSKQSTRKAAAEILTSRGGTLAADMIEDMLLDRDHTLERTFRRELSTVLVTLSYKHMDAFSEKPETRMRRNLALSSVRCRN